MAKTVTTKLLYFRHLGPTKTIRNLPFVSEIDSVYKSLGDRFSSWNSRSLDAFNGFRTLDPGVFYYLIITSASPNY